MGQLNLSMVTGLTIRFVVVAPLVDVANVEHQRQESGGRQGLRRSMPRQGLSREIEGEAFVACCLNCRNQHMGIPKIVMIP